MTSVDVTEQVKSLLLTLWEAQSKPHVKAWAIHIALTYAINRDPNVNKRDVWQLIHDEYIRHLRERFSAPARSGAELPPRGRGRVGDVRRRIPQQ